MSVFSKSLKPTGKEIRKIPKKKSDKETICIPSSGHADSHTNVTGPDRPEEKPDKKSRRTESRNKRSVKRLLPFRKDLQTHPKTCIIDVGGGLRGIYAAGVLDRLLDEQVEVDLCIGVSAGSANLATYIAKQKGRCYTYYHDYGFRKEYASVSNFLKKRAFFDMDYIYGTLSNQGGEYPIDYPVIASSRTELVSVATNALSGKPVYFTKNRVRQNDYSVMKGSCAVPYLCHTWNVAGVPFCDGTVSDPIPIQKALELGAERIVILFPRRPELLEKDKWSERMLEILERTSAYGRTFPNVSKALRQRNNVNNRSFRLAKKLEEEGKLLFVCAEHLYDVKSLGASPDNVDRLYRLGYEDGLKAAAFLQKPAAAS